MAATSTHPLIETAVRPASPGDPISHFNAWLEEATRAGLPEPATMSLATADESGHPAVRIVQLKRADARGFEFYTNLQSAKGVHLTVNPRGALCFYWQPLGRQVRVRGEVERVSDAEADATFASRPRLLQIGSWASKQSQPMRGALDLEQACAAVAIRYPFGRVPRPDFWSGFRLTPQTIEFSRQLQLGRFERVVHERRDDGWSVQRLFP